MESVGYGEYQDLQLVRVWDTVGYGRPRGYGTFTAGREVYRTSLGGPASLMISRGASALGSMKPNTGLTR